MDTGNSETDTQRLEQLVRLLAGYEIAIRDELRSTRDRKFLEVLYSKKAETSEKIRREIMYGAESKPHGES